MKAFIKRLNLPGLPLRDHAYEELIKIKTNYVDTVTKSKSVLPVVLHAYVIDDIEKFLTPELLSVFRSLDAEPTYFINFGQIDKLCYTTPVHKDISPMDKNRPIPFAINWELSDVNSLWRWWDTAHVPEIAPPIFHDVIQRSMIPEHHRNLIAGVRYGNLEEFNDESNAKLGFRVIGAQQVLTHTAYMVRTDVPHSITYTNSSPVRISISLRFSMEKIPTWEDAIKLFEPLIVEH
jgi:hypothetical protein